MILVTGATGFLGSRVAARLVAGGRAVRVLVRETSDTRRLDGLAVERAVGDVTDLASVDRATRGATTVVHCAAHYAFGADPVAMRRTNVEGTRNVLGAAADHGAIAVHVSSVVALGPTGAAPADEAHWSAEAPRSSYAATKREAHLVAREAKARIVLPGTIYGPDDPSPVGWLHALGARGLLPVGFHRRVAMSLVHVDDCADAVVRAIDRGRPAEEYIAVADVVTFEEWLRAIARVSGTRPPRRFIGERSLAVVTRALGRVAPESFLGEALAMSDRASWAFSSEKARRELGWKPRSLDDGLAETLRWYSLGRGKGLRWIFGSTR